MRAVEGGNEGEGKTKKESGGGKEGKREGGGKKRNRRVEKPGAA